MKALITGVNGFVGGHLAEHLLAQNYHVHGTVLPGTSTGNISAIRDRLDLSEADICDPKSIMKAIACARPDRIFHLAAASSVADSFLDPVKTLDINVSGSINLFEAVRALGIEPAIVVAGSAEVYGEVPKKKLPIKEEYPFAPLNPYAISKAAVDMFAYQYFRNFGLKIVRSRSFNHIGPGQSENFVVASFAKQIAEIERGFSGPLIRVGNLGARRDFTDVGDVARAYRMLAEKGVAGEAYNVCSGKVHSVREILDILISFSEVKIRVEIDKQRIRPSDIMINYGDPSKLRKATGWRPSVPLKESLRVCLEYWRERISQRAVR